MKPRKVKPQQGNVQRSDAIVFFDGICNLCNGTVDFLIRNNPVEDLLFSPLQGETAKELILPAFREETLPDSILFYRDGILYSESDAALQICRHLKWYQAWLRLFLVFPRPLRDTVYRWVARNRYRWFGKRESCRIPSPEEAARFLD